MISVIMSCNNSKKEYLHAAVSSILNQTYKDFEFLIADNGVKDFNLENFLKDFQDDRIKYIDNHGNIGAALSYNLLAIRAEGEYIAIQDHDDISLPWRLEIEKNALDRNKDLMSVSSTIKVFGGKREYFDGVAMKPGQVKEELLFWQPIKQPTFMKRKEFCNNYKYNPNYFIYDYEFWSRTREIPHEILPDCLLHYRKSPLNSSKERWNKVREEHAKIVKNNLRKLDIYLPLQTCEMLDPFNRTKHTRGFTVLFEHYKDKLLENISAELYSKKLKEIQAKILKL